MADCRSLRQCKPSTCLQVVQFPICSSVASLASLPSWPSPLFPLNSRANVGRQSQECCRGIAEVLGNRSRQPETLKLQGVLDWCSGRSHAERRQRRQAGRRGPGEVNVQGGAREPAWLASIERRQQGFACARRACQGSPRERREGTGNPGPRAPRDKVGTVGIAVRWGRRRSLCGHQSRESRRADGGSPARRRLREQEAP